MPRFSKLKKRIESLFHPDLDLKVYCNTYYKGGCFICKSHPRFWIVFNKEIIFDFIKDFMDLRIPDPENKFMWESGGRHVYYQDISNINCMVAKYIEVPKDKIFDHAFPDDYFGLTDILKAADRRIGKKRLLILRNKTQSESAKKVIEARFS